MLRGCRTRVADRNAPSPNADNTQECDRLLTGVERTLTLAPMGTVAALLRRLFGQSPRHVVEPHAFVASMTMIPTTPSNSRAVAEPLAVASIRCNREDCGRPRQDPVHHIAED